jgi:hypothetical protein
VYVSERVTHTHTHTHTHTQTSYLHKHDGCAAQNSDGDEYEVDFECSVGLFDALVAAKVISYGTACNNADGGACVCVVSIKV